MQEDTRVERSNVYLIFTTVMAIFQPKSDLVTNRFYFLESVSYLRDAT